MTTVSVPAASPPKAMIWAGWIVTLVVTAFLVMDGTMKVMQLPVVTSATTELGYDTGIIFPLGLTILAIAALYAIPRTAVLGAILMTGLYGGTVATHLMAGNPLFSHMLFGVYLGVMAWGGLWLRDARIRALIPFRG